MKYITCTLAVLMLTFFALSAQNAELPEVKAKKMVGKVSGAVTLSGAQIAKVNNLYIDYYRQREVIKSNKKLTKEVEAEKLDALQRKRDKALKEVLGSEGFKKWEAYKEAEKASEKAEKKAQKQTK